MLGKVGFVTESTCPYLMHKYMPRILEIQSFLRIWNYGRRKQEGIFPLKITRGSEGKKKAIGIILLFI